MLRGLYRQTLIVFSPDKTDFPGTRSKEQHQIILTLKVAKKPKQKTYDTPNIS